MKKKIIKDGIQNPVTNVAGIFNVSFKADDIEEGTVLTTEDEPDNKYDEKAVAVFFGNTRIGYLPAKSTFREYHEYLNFTVKEVKCNRGGFISNVLLNISGHETLEDTIQDNQTAKPGYDINSEGGYRIYWKDGKYYPSITSILQVKVESEQLQRWLLTHESYEHYVNNLGRYATRGTIVHNALEDYINTKVIYNKEYFVQKDLEYRDEIDQHNDKRDAAIDEFGYTKLPEKEYKSLLFDTKGVPGKASFKETDNALYQMYMGGIKFLTLPEVEIIEAERMLMSEKHGIAGSCDALIKYKGEYLALDYKTSKSVQKKSYKLQASFYASAYGELDITENKQIKAGLLRLDQFTKKGYQFVEVDNQLTHESMLAPMKAVFEYLHSDL